MGAKVYVASSADLPAEAERTIGTSAKVTDVDKIKLAADIRIRKKIKIFLLYFRGLSFKGLKR